MGATLHRRPEDVLGAVAAPGEKVVLLGLDEVGDESWAVLGAAGLAVVRVADVPAALEVLGDPATHVAIADALERLLDDPALWERRSARGREFVADRTWDRSARQLEAGLRTALREREGW